MLNRQNSFQQVSATIRRFGRQWEGTFWRNRDGEPSGGGVSRSESNRCPLLAELNRRDDEQSAVARARKNHRQGVLGGEHHRIDVLTVGGERVPVDDKEFNDLVQSFLTPKVRFILWGRHWRHVTYTLAPELGEENGRPHVNLTCNAPVDFVPFRVVIDAWSAHCESKGYHSPTGRHRISIGWLSGSRPEAVARYVTKAASFYVTKGERLLMMPHRPGAHRHRVSPGCVPPPENLTFYSWGAVQRFIESMGGTVKFDEFYNGCRCVIGTYGGG